jgi:hypothetical protein
MIISDLNHVEVVSEETETRIVGGLYWTESFYKVFNSPQGLTTSTSTFTRTFSPPGSGGSSSSSSSTTVSFWRR